MKATKGYLGVLGTVGLLTASVVVLLLVGSGAAALEGPADAGGAASPLERIVVEEDAWWADRRARARADRGGAALGRSGARGLREGLARDGHPGDVLADGSAGGGTVDSPDGDLPGGPSAGSGGGAPGAGSEGGAPGGDSPGKAGRDPDQGGSGGGNGDGKPLPGAVGDTVGGALDGVAPGLGAPGLGAPGLHVGPSAGSPVGNGYSGALS